MQAATVGIAGKVEFNIRLWDESGTRSGGTGLIPVLFLDRQLKASSVKNDERFDYRFERRGNRTEECKTKTHHDS
jgi:hypothetical protein